MLFIFRLKVHDVCVPSLQRLLPLRHSLPPFDFVLLVQLFINIVRFVGDDFGS